MGKTTLLRAIADRELQGIPSHVQILHVEQEVRFSLCTVLKWDTIHTFLLLGRRQ